MFGIQTGNCLQSALESLPNIKARAQRDFESKLSSIRDVSSECELKAAASQVSVVTQPLVSLSVSQCIRPEPSSQSVSERVTERARESQDSQACSSPPS